MNLLMQPMYAKDRSEWRTWLENNYSEEKEILLIYYKTSTNYPSITWEESVEEALCFGWIDGVRKRIDDEKYSIRFTPRKSGSVWSKINKEKISKLIDEGKMTDAGLKVVEEAKKSGAWDSAYRMKDDTKDLPEDFSEALNQSPAALEFFNALSNSNKFSYLFQINNIKTKALREERIKRVIYLLEKKIKPYIGQKSSITNKEL